jgi:phosphatidylglycerophosphate synthase
VLTQQRHRFEPYKQWLGRRLGRLGLPPSFYTLLGLALAALASCIYSQGSPLGAALCGTAASLTDFVDGAVARQQNRVTAWGDYLEAIVDRLVELTLLLTLASALGSVVSFAIAGSMLISYCKPRVALVVPADNHDWPGVGDHSDRMVLILLAMALSGVLPAVAQALLWVLVALTAVGTAQRIRYAHGLIEKGSRAWPNSEE